MWEDPRSRRFRRSARGLVNDPSPVRGTGAGEAREALTATGNPAGAQTMGRDGAGAGGLSSCREKRGTGRRMDFGSHA